MMLCDADELRGMSDAELEANDIAMADEMAMFSAEYKSHKADLTDQFRDYLYSNYSISNGAQLIAILEQGEALENFLADNDLPEYTQIEL